MKLKNRRIIFDSEINPIRDIGNEKLASQKKIDVENAEKALLNILDDYSQERLQSENTQSAMLNILIDFDNEKVNMESTQRAVLNVLEDFGEEKINMERTQRAVLNILDDFGEEKVNMESTQRAVLNILDDFREEKVNMESTQRAVLNILEDFGVENKNMEGTHSAVLNILDDFSEEKVNMERTQRAVLNILDDFSEEKIHMESTQRAVLNILDDFREEKVYMVNTQRAVLNILEDFREEKINMESTQRAILNILDDYAKEKENVETVNTNLASVNKELEQFIYSASHDLQEPVRMVILYLQLIEKKYKDKLDKDGNDFINFALDGSNRMRSLILSLLDYSNVNSEQPFEIIDANKLLQEVLIFFSDKIRETKAVVTVESLPVIFGDKVLMRKLFHNLISNAFNFRSERNPEILISGKKNNDELLFSVKDNGIGIQKEYGDKLFKIFQRLNPRDQYPGTGIGLVVCKKIVEKHGGKIWFESEFGKGTTFYFAIKEKPKK